ncbi:MAG: histidine kinase [Treponema sp.]|nr:histidine kinase [Treponema sp.]
MYKGIKFIRDWSMSARQFLIFLFFAFLIFSILQVRTIINTAHTIKQSELNRYQSTAEDASRYLDHLMESINGVLISQSANWSVFLPGREDEALDLLRKYNDYGVLGIKVMYFCRSDGTILCGKQVLFDIFGNPYINKFYDEMKIYTYGIRYTDPYYTYFSQNAISACSIVRDSGGNSLGVLIAECSIDTLQKALNVYLATNEYSYVLLTPKGNIITYYANKLFLPTIAHTWPPKLTSEIMETITAADAGFINYKDGILIFSSFNNKFGWHLAALINTNPLNASINALYRNMVLELLGYFIILALTSFGLTIWLMRPIRKIVLRMRSINNISDLSEIEESQAGEVGKLIDSYNFMMRSITQLKNDCQSYELKMLRSQIGPHFLYNTLSCISLMAKQQRIDDVQSMIRSLINLLSFSFDRHDEFVSLNSEIKSVENYIDIQKMRLDMNFSFIVDEDQKSIDCFIPKLTLQPIVENAILHGVLPKTTSNKKIYLRTKCYGALLVIMIVDNGIGMSDKTIKNVMETEDSIMDRDKFSGIGIYNVDKRIKLYYGNNYGIKIKSRPNIGTIVRLSLPI